MNSLFKICNYIYDGYIPDTINKSLLTIIPKTAQSIHIKDYRLIAISPLLIKLVAFIINKRLMDNIICIEQSGFMSHQECTAQVIYYYIT